MKQESKFKQTVIYYLKLFVCIFTIRVIILPAVREHNIKRRAEKERIEAYQSLLSSYAYFLQAMAETESDSIAVHATAGSPIEE